MPQSLRSAVGSLLVVGVHSMELSALERAWLRVVRPGGVILFRRNISDCAQTRELLQSAAELCAPHALRCVDLEGGTVDRLRDALAPMPSAEAVALAARGTDNPKLARQHGELVARAVRAFGFNTTLAPVLDIGLPQSANVMGSRTAGATPAEVIAYAREFLAGLAEQGIAGCGKHFPGLGAGTLDSHFDTPRIERDLKTMLRDDIEPFRALARQLPMVMVNHASYPATPGGDMPATASLFWITKVLRRQLDYRGIIFSDDLEMGGILKRMPMDEAAVSAIRAGMDTLEICHSPELILAAFEGLLAQAERSSAFRATVQGRAVEVARKRARLFRAGTPRPLTAAQFRNLQTRIHQFREFIAKLAEPSEPAPQKPVAPVVETA